MKQHNYKLLIAYDGTCYSGWQLQSNATSIQSLIQNALETILREKVTLIGSGRTDAGVHALGQIAHFKCDSEINLYKLLGSLNGILPRDIRILEATKVSLDFHAQRSAISKTYHYNLYLDKILDPFQRLYVWHIYDRHCDISLLKEATSLFVGTHDFTSFANEAHAGSASINPIRTIDSIEIIEKPSGLCLSFKGNGFLYKMVRNIVGTVVEVAAKQRSLNEIATIFSAKDRRTAGQAAPPQGLFLMQVEYPTSYFL